MKHQIQNLIQILAEMANDTTASEGYKLACRDIVVLLQAILVPANIEQCEECKQTLTEYEYNFYENRRLLARLCKKCTMDERAR